MERQKKVIDASVIMKWFLNEEDSDKAIEIKNRYTENKIILIVPELLFIEVINVLRYKKKDFEDLKKINNFLWNLQFKVEKANRDVIDKAIEISIKNNFTIYDSIYIALSQIHGCELITADKELVKIPNVKLLKDVEI